MRKSDNNIKPQSYSVWSWREMICLSILLIVCAVGSTVAHEVVIAECDQVGSGGASATRGIQFSVNQNFTSIEVRMAGSTAGSYQFTAELRRSEGFAGAFLAAVSMDMNLPLADQPPYHVVHIDFPVINVSGAETFTLRFVDVSGPGTLFHESANWGVFPCDDMIVTTNNIDSVPTPLASATGLTILSLPGGCGDCLGDLNGDLVIDIEDLAILLGNWLKDCNPIELPVLILKGGAFDEGMVSSMSEFFKVNSEMMVRDGVAIRYTDPQKFQYIPTILAGEEFSEEDNFPTVVELIDFNNIKGAVIDDKTAVGIVNQAFEFSGFEVPVFQPLASVDHSMFEAVKADGEPIVSVPLDTQVNYEFMFDAMPVTGPGAKLKFVFNEESELTHMTMALPLVEGAGQSYEIISQQEADQLALEMYGFSQSKAIGNIQLTSKLVYWIPVDVSNITQLVPQYLYGGTMRNSATGEDISLRQVLIPAISRQLAPQLIPEVQLFVDPSGNTMFAGTEVGGGSAPYTYSWTSSTTDLSGNTGPSIQYTVMARKGLPSPTHEILTVVVTDAAGVSTSASETIPLIIVKSESGGLEETDQKLMVVGIRDVGAEWIGTSQGLSGSSGNAGGFIDRFNAEAGITVRFNWGDFNAWERDFKDPAFAGGDDSPWIDNVDAAFYTGHANGDGFTFPGTVNDGFLHYTEARWGNNDLEWLVIAACGPLQLESDGKQWYQRWGPAFRGLHLICGYQTVSNDNTVEGGKYAAYLLQGKTVRQAWVDTATEVQPSSVRYGIMGVFGTGGRSNINDHFWGEGSVGSDITGTDITGYWMIHGPS